MNNQAYIDEIYLHAKDPYETEYQYLIKNREDVGIRHLLNIQIIWKTFIKILKNTMQENKGKVLLVFDDMIADIIIYKKLNPIVTELFTRNRKLNISLVFITQKFFRKPKDVRLNCILLLLWKFQ